MPKVLLRLRPEEWLLLPFLLVLLALHGGGGLSASDVAARVGRELRYDEGEFGLFWYFGLWIFGGAFVLSILLRTRAFAPLAEWWRRPVAAGESAVPKRVAEGVLRAGDGRAAHVWGLLGTARVALAAVRGYAPFLACFAIYSLLRDLVYELRPGVLYDEPLLALDRAVFGVDPFRWVQDIFSGSWCAGWIDPFLVASYSSYMYAAPLLACLLFAVADVRGFRHLMLAVSLASFLGYLGYVAVPVVGPCVAFPELYARTAGDGSALMIAMEAFRGDETRDAFPSLHTAWTVLLLLAAWRYRRFVFWLYLPFACGVLVAVFYFGKHYGVDVVAGLGLAALAWWLAARIDAWYDGLRERHGLAPLRG